jgi:MiaB/RimO family radical SAM methylthiotransferase
MLKSRSPDEISEAVQKLLKSGVVEVQLAAQDTAAYGLDIGTTLPELIERIEEIPGRFMVRIGMMNPDTAGPILDELADVLHSPKVYSFLHMPVQSGSDRILQSMGRRYSAGDYQRIVDYIRRSVDDISLITDVIAGYPGETDEDFRQTIDLLRAVQPDKVNVTRYSSRPGTPASQLYDMPDRIKKDRSRELTRLWLELAAQRNRRYKGTILDALVTEQGRGNTMKARAVNYTGIVIEGKPALGSTVRVKVTGSNAFYVMGRVLPQ